MLDRQTPPPVNGPAQRSRADLDAAADGPARNQLWHAGRALIGRLDRVRASLRRATDLQASGGHEEWRADVRAVREDLRMAMDTMRAVEALVEAEADRLGQADPTQCGTCGATLDRDNPPVHTHGRTLGVCRACHDSMEEDPS